MWNRCARLRRATTSRCVCFSQLQKRFLGMETRTRIAVIGDTFGDILASGATQLPAWGKDTLVNEIQLLPGGSALNTACAMKNASRSLQMLQIQQHLDVSFYSAVGADALGGICHDYLQELGISGMKRLPDATTGSCIVISGCNDRAFVTSQGAMDQLSFDLFDFENDFLKAQHVHIGGYYNCPRLRRELPAVLQQMKARGVTVSVNPQYDASERWEGFDENVAGYIDVLVASLDEARCIAGVNNNETPEETAKRLCRLGMKVVVITLGAEGAVATERTTNDIKLHRVNATSVDVVDTTGAGDAFAAGFVSVWALTKNVDLALRFGCANGAAMVTVFGGSTAVSNEKLSTIYNSLTSFSSPDP